MKVPALRVAATLPDLHGAAFEALFTGYHEVWGQLDSGPALELLEQLDPQVGHFDTLRTVLRQGHANHYGSPGAWRAAGSA